MDVAALRAAIAAEVARFGVPGCGVALVHDGAVVLAEGFGLRDVDAGLPVTDQTLFPIGSSTKAFTSSLIATLVDEGRFDWDTPVVDLLPGFRMHDPVATQHLTPRDMLCHRSGLPRHDILWYNNTALSRADVVRRLRHLEPNRGFRQTWQYNNLLYISAGHLAEHLLGCTWEQAVRERLLEPLGMTNTNFSVAESQKSKDHSLPYLEKDGVTRAIPLRGLDLAGPAGSINSTVADMARWALLNATGGEVDGTRMLSTAALRELHGPNMVLAGNELSSVSDLYPETYMTAYGLGWVLESYRGARIVHHGGNIDGFSAMVSLLPAENLGVVVLTNLNGTPARDVIPYLVYDHVLGLDPLPWGERMRDVHAAAKQGVKAARQHAEAKVRAAPPSHPLEDYAGEYAHPGYGPFRFTITDGALVPHYNDIDELELVHRHYDTWELRIELFEAVIPVRFAMDDDGEIELFSAPLEGAVEPIVFTRQPDPALSDPSRLGALAGQYAMGPLVLTVEHEVSKGLAATLMGERYELRPHRGDVFTVADHPSLRMELSTDAAGARRVVIDQIGVFEEMKEND
jgi:CubicO group peptidase (beta-lactamase class C family)